MKSKGDVAGLVSERDCEFLPSVLCCAHLVSFWNEQVFRMDLGVCRKSEGRKEVLASFSKIKKRCQIDVAPAFLQIFSSHGRSSGEVSFCRSEARSPASPIIENRNFCRVMGMPLSLWHPENGWRRKWRRSMN